MGNSLGAKKLTKVMKIDGETLKLKTPVRAAEVVKDYPGHVLLDSESVKHYGVRAKPLEPQQELKPKRLYFLVDLPNQGHNNSSLLPGGAAKVARRARSGINMSAKDRLESLALTRRSVSDLSILKPNASVSVEDTGVVRRVTMRLPKAEVERLVGEAKDQAEAAQKLVGLCVKGSGGYAGATAAQLASRPIGDGASPGRTHWKGGGEGREVRDGGFKRRDQRRVGFHPINEGEIQQVAVSVS